MKRLNFLETTLIITAVISGFTSVLLGLKVKSIETIGRVASDNKINEYRGIENVANSIETGFTGGAIGFAIISATCLILTTWIEITRLKLDK